MHWGFMRSELSRYAVTNINTASVTVTKATLAKVTFIALVPRQRMLEISVFQISDNEHKDDQQFRLDQWEQTAAPTDSNTRKPFWRPFD